MFFIIIEYFYIQYSYAGDTLISLTQPCRRCVRMSDLKKLKIAGCSYLEDSEGIHVFHVDSPHTLMQAIGYLKHTANPWERIFLRGQSHIYKTLSPTLYRGIVNVATQARRHERLGKVIEEFKEKCELFGNVEQFAREPLLQHYGIQTTWLDIVDNVWVALWFALHRVTVSGPDKQYLHFDARSTEVDGEFGYIFLIKAQDSRREKVRKGFFKGGGVEVVDLRVAVPSVFLRPHAQHGLLFRVRGTQEGRVLDYSNAISGIIRFKIRDGLAWLGTGTMHNIRGLFPTPYFDKGYQLLLGVSQSEKLIGVISHIGA